MKNGVIQQITQGRRLKSANNKRVNSGKMEWTAVIKLDSRGDGSRSTVRGRCESLNELQLCPTFWSRYRSLHSTVAPCRYLDVFASKHL